MSHVLSSRVVGIVLGAIMAMLVAAPALLITNDAHAQGALEGSDLFGGSDDFGAQAGLGEGDLQETIAAIIRAALGFLGIIAVVIILAGGFQWMTAGGNDDKVQKAKKLMISGVIGLVIVLSAYSIATFVIGQISSATAGAGA